MITYNKPQTEACWTLLNYLPGYPGFLISSLLWNPLVDWLNEASGSLGLGLEIFCIFNQLPGTARAV